MIEPGRGAAYAVLFSEIGVTLLITTLAGVLAGRWVDAQLNSLPIFVIVVGSSRVDLQACKLEYSIVSPK